jgi:glycosyltransferase involved in cell wall biosynthesis
VIKAEEKPTLSVIVPVYNVEPYLRACVDSILAQTFRDFELILVDDGSTDGCPALCDAYEGQDPRVRVIHKENGGLSSARNAGMRSARAELLSFIDSDDFVHPQMFQTLVARCLSTLASGSLCVHTSAASEKTNAI